MAGAGFARARRAHMIRDRFTGRAASVARPVFPFLPWVSGGWRVGSKLVLDSRYELCV